MRVANRHPLIRHMMKLRAEFNAVTESTESGEEAQTAKKFWAIRRQQAMSWTD